MINDYSDNYWRIHKISEKLVYLKEINVPLYDIELLKENKIAFGVNLYTSERVREENLSLTIGKIEKGIEILNILNEGLKFSYPEQSENSIIIKTTPLKYLEDVKEFSTKLNKAMDMLIGSAEFLDNTEIRFQNFDTGSSWFEICFETAMAVSLMSTAVRCALKMQIEISEYQVIKARLSRIKKTELNLQALESDHMERMRELISKEFSEVNGKPNELDEEYLTKVHKSIEILHELLQEGATFETSLKATEEVKKSFPTMPLLKSISKKEIDHKK